MRAIWLRLLEFFDRDRRERRLSDEVQSHLDLLAEEHMARGLSAQDARLAARRSFGGVDQIKERYRDQRGLPLLDVLFQDLRFSSRLMRKNAAFSFTAAASLALSIGALTLAFTLVNALVLKPLPIADPATVYFMQNGTGGWSYPDYRDLRDRIDVAALAGYRISMMNVGLDPAPEILWGYLATGNYFQALGISPAAGRFFAPEEDTQPGAAPFAVLAYDTWQARFGGRASIVGSTLAINGLPYTILGIAPRGFHGTEVFYRPEIWVPMSMQAQIELGSSWLERRETQNLMVVARLRPHLTVQQSEAALAAAVTQLSGEHRRNGPLGLRLERPGLFGSRLGDPARMFAWGLFGLGALLMLAGCSNLAGLLLARGNDRAREIAMRSALGAGKSRIARQLLTESVMLACCGGIGGAALAWAGTRVISAWRLPTELPVQLNLVADTTVIAFATVTAVIVGVIVGIAPARFATRLDLNQSLKTSSGVMVAGRRLQGREILVGIQVALCVVLLHASFLSVRGLQRAATASIGWNPDGIVVAATELGLARYNGARAATYWRQAVAEARALPAVAAATIGNSMPLHIDQSSSLLLTYPATEPETGAGASVYQIAPGYFSTLQIPLRDGRDFTDFDTADSPPVVIVNRALAERLFGSANPIGRQVREGRGGQPLEIIGLVEDGKYVAIAEARRPAFFRPLTQRFATSAVLIVRATSPGSIRPEHLRRVIHGIDPALPIRATATGEQITALPLLPYRAAVFAFGLLGLIGSGLLLSGLYAMLAYAVVKRRREIGIRVALGASRGHVVRAILARLFAILATGMALGGLCSAGTGPLVSSMVLGVSPREPALVAAIVALLAVIGLVSCIGPVRRSLRVDPLTALREE
jgi:predicted permease